jgi:hypothetical protein
VLNDAAAGLCRDIDSADDLLGIVGGHGLDDVAGNGLVAVEVLGGIEWRRLLLHSVASCRAALFAVLRTQAPVSFLDRMDHARPPTHQTAGAAAEGVGLVARLCWFFPHISILSAALALE